MVCRVSCILELKRNRLVQRNRIGNSLGKEKKKVSTKPMGVCSGKVFTALVCGGGGVADIK